MSDTEGECQMALKGLDIDETTRLCIYTVSAPHSHRVLIIQSATINVSIAFFSGEFTAALLVEHSVHSEARWFMSHDTRKACL